MRSLSNRVVLLTGAAGGIGAAMARQLSAQGARLALVDRDGEGMRALASELPASTTCHEIDLSRPELLEPLVAEVIDAHGELSVLIANAGVTIHAPFGELKTSEIDLVLDVDLRGVLHLVAHALPHLREADEAHIVLVSSMAGLQAFPLQSIYGAAKHGLRAYGEALRMELGAENIGVTTLLPGTIATGFMANAGDHDLEETTQMVRLMKRWGTSPERVARAGVRGILKNRGRIRVGWDCHLVSALQWIAPPLLPLLLTLGARRRLRGQVTD